MTIAVVTAGLSTPSATRLLADELAAAVGRKLDVDIEIIELRELAHPIVDNMLTGFPRAELAHALDAVAAADGVIVVTPIFAASYSGMFKAFFDVLDKDALAGTPVLIAATGGTERHSLVLEHALRPLFAYLRAHVVPTAVYAATSDFGPHRAGLAERVERATDEFGELVTRLERRPRSGQDDDIVPFAQLLAG
jgi:FMN reductase